MSSLKQFLYDEGYDVEKLQRSTWSAKRGREIMAELEAKYAKPKLPQRLMSAVKRTLTKRER